jgi:hypothetical protein
MADAATTGADLRYSHAFVITPGTTEFTNNTRRIYVGLTGRLVIVTPNDEEVTLQNVPVGFHDILAKKVLATSTVGSPTETTTAAMLVGFY